MLRGAPSQHFDVESTPPALTIIPMPTSNNNRTAERLPSRPLAPAERLPPRPLASNDNHLSSPSVQNNNNNHYTPRVNSPHSHPPHHKGMRDQSLSLHPYLGRDSDLYGLMTPTSANNNKTKSPSISSNHSNNHSFISNQYSNISNHNDNYSDRIAACCNSETQPRALGTCEVCFAIFGEGSFSQKPMPNRT